MTDGQKTRITLLRWVFYCEERWVKWRREHTDWIRQKAVYSFVCACCGKAFTAYDNSRHKYCSHKCYIQDCFKGGGADD